MSNYRYTVQKSYAKAVLQANIFWPYIAQILDGANRIDVEVDLREKLGPDLGEAARLYLRSIIKYDCFTGQIVGFNVYSLANSAYSQLQQTVDLGLNCSEVEQVLLDVIREMYPDLNVGIVRG